ncbi:MAG: DAK2 domain-containing protein [Brevibacterium sp.]|uniref:DAK2 domain-containing protein n=1 Tax=Brevibacterium sp. TaxID=1701 RepID=UPI00264856CC|nr:DAK2 domain-containing protein [Brevibacterium sp.]MDN5834732.1 DAK2 domain-containing protein [Brevibacterium sp.]MDN5877332.1 DAK2 domain-containing protein [Brevibacterium sp.]MDN5910165.1 DAK2 domain-containing protein [Brevibacterium sp.]MDN6158550.1 DAK2 domain-containing protein [Brevibacterium sp.]MDN6176203.1 DAK2 domain-containing protein [Brevibacterium sp.]
MSGPNQAIGLNGRLAARWARRAVDRLRKERVEIDELNVFPVPDGDTGTNMYHTLRSAYLAVEELTGPVTLPQVVAALAEGAGRGARGNSGLILAVALQGVADALDGVTVATPAAMASALEHASSRARQSVARPVDGTMLTVLDAMATEAREKAESGANLIELIAAVRLRSRSALRETTGQLPMLREAAVVDAGSTGIVELFDLLYATVTGRTPQDSMLVEVTRSPQVVHQASADELEIVAILATNPAPSVPGEGAAGNSASALAEALEGLGGTSIVINGTKVHVHVADEATAVTVLDHLAGYGIARLDMEDLRLHEEEGETHVVVIASGTGLLMHCALNGATALTPDTRDAIRLTTDIIAEEEREVLIVPSSTSVLKSLEQITGGRVVRSRNIATLLSALAVYDPFAPAGEIFADMTEAAAGTRVGTIVSAEQLALRPPTGALPIIDDSRSSHPSQFYRVFIDGKAKTQSTELTTLVEKLADRLLGAGGELLTVVHGPGCTPDVLSHLRDWIRKSHAQVRFQDIDSRDRTTLLIMGVE